METTRSSEEYVTPEMFVSVGNDEQASQASLYSPSQFRQVESEEQTSGTSEGNVASHLFELSSISIRLHDWGALPEIQIFGYITLIDDSGNEFIVFKRGFDDPETVVVLDSISAILQISQLNFPYWIPKRFSLKLNLYDKIRSIQFIDDQRSVDFCGYIAYDNEQELKFNKSEYGIVTVRYTIFRCAVLASVEFTVSRNDGGSFYDDTDPDDVAAVRGTIAASSKVLSMKEIPRVIYDKNLEDADVIVINDPKELSQLAVPAYSSLIIQADLEVEGERIANSVEFKPDLSYPGIYSKIIVGCKWRIQMGVLWRHAYVYRNHLVIDNFDSDPPYRKIVYILPDFLQESDSDPDSDSDCGERSPENPQEKRTKLSSEQFLVSGISNQRALPSFTYHKYTRKLVEVFSVVVGSFARVGGALRLYGTIKSYDALNEDYLIFKRDKRNPVKLSSRNTVALDEQHHCYEAEALRDTRFGMFFDLKDAEGREISKGYVKWDNYTARGWDYRLICSVVRGKDGFAAVHYTILEHAVAAKLKVTLASFGSRCQVYGKSCASYSTYNYSKVYEKEHYRSMLFEKGMSEFVELDGGVEVEVPLLKYVVAVPVDASLIVEADLCIVVEGAEVEIFRGEVKFNPKKSKISDVRSINGYYGSSQLSVYVEWG